MRIDLHSHYYPAQYLGQLERCGLRGVGVLRGLHAGDAPEELEARLRDMDRARVKMQVLSAGAHGPYFARPEDAIVAARTANDTYAEVVRRHPGRFALFASTPLPHLDAAMRELERAIDELHAVGVNVTTSVLGKPIADPAFDPFFEELNRRRAALFIHPAGVGACSPHVEEYGLTWAIGAPIEDTVVALQLIARKFPQRYPEIRIVISHLGGALPMLIARLDHLMPLFGTPLDEKPSATARRMWYDTVAHNSSPALRCAGDTLGWDRLVLGSDYPYQSAQWYQGCVEYIESCGRPAADVRAILEDNPAAVLLKPAN
ncbi:MAG TPA: amidohydrolase family protein [Candidatus Binataceae bacterium]|nr:amidohydrolase family protein [Candidatus Binataceae bacterium]